MRIRDVMATSPQCCVPSDTAAKAARIMKDLDIGLVPIVDHEQSRRLIGVVTDWDLWLEVVAGRLDPHSVRVGECMTGTLVCCNTEEEVQKTIDLMCNNRVRRIPVVDHQGTIQGVVSLADLMQCSLH